MRCVGVEFKNNGKQYIFNCNGLDINEEDNLIVETERGLQFGKAKIIYGNLEDGKEHSNVIKIADKSDEIQNKKNIKEAASAVEKAQELSESAIPRVETKRSVGQRYHVFQV